jgi:tetratricopeptide (TPR) repeat protein
MPKITIRALLIILPILCFASLQPVAAAAEKFEGNDKEIVERALVGQEAIFARDYPKAMEVFDALERDFPGSPAGYFGKMAVYEMRMFEREDTHLQKEFLAESKKGLALVKKINQKYNPSTWDLFLAGSLLGLDGFFKARHDQWWDAYVQGGKSRQLFRRVKKMDPGFIDADFGLGMYLYWRSVFTRDLWFLNMFPDKRNEGIAIVKNVAENGRFAKELARANLGIMYFEEKRYKQAETIFSDFVRRYPNNVIMRKIYGKILISQKRYDQAIEQFERMMAVDPVLKKPRYFIGVALILKGDPAGYPRAVSELNQFIKLQGGKYWPAFAHYWLGRLAAKKGDKAAAEKEYQEAVRLYPKIEDTVKKARGMGGGV